MGRILWSQFGSLYCCKRNLVPPNLVPPKLTRSWFIENAIETLTWPAQSPDLNPIENIWDYMEFHIRSTSIKHLAATLEELGQALLEEWGKIPKSMITRLVDGM